METNSASDPLHQYLFQQGTRFRFQRAKDFKRSISSSELCLFDLLIACWTVTCQPYNSFYTVPALAAAGQRYSGDIGNTTVMNHLNTGDAHYVVRTRDQDTLPAAKYCLCSIYIHKLWRENIRQIKTIFRRLLSSYHLQIITFWQHFCKITLARSFISACSFDNMVSPLVYVVVCTCESI
jgi:hypothetical protein